MARLVATFPGRQAEEEITITAGAALKVELELKPVSVQTSVTVSETYNDATVPAVIETITQKTIDDAPKVNERFESLLPLVPGVVRGPDGRSNMKGARNTQCGTAIGISGMGLTQIFSVTATQICLRSRVALPVSGSCSCSQTDAA